jgi:hypothetical protein
MLGADMLRKVRVARYLAVVPGERQVTAMTPSPEGAEGSMVGLHARFLSRLRYQFPFSLCVRLSILSIAAATTIKPTAIPNLNIIRASMM